MAFCLLPNKVEEFKKALREKQITLADLIKLDHADLVKMLEPYAGVNAKDVALMIEEKLILKNRVLGLKNAISKLTESGRYSPKRKAELEQIAAEYKAAQMKRVFSPKENESFLGGVAEKITGTEITKEEAMKAFELSEKASELRKVFENSDVNKSNEYGAAKVVYEKYLESLKNPDLPLSEVIKEYGEEIGELWKENKPATVVKILTDTISKTSETAISGAASWDNSFIGRQGAITLIKNPKIWWNMARKSFTDFYKTLKGQEPLDVLMADIYGRRNSVEGLYEKAKLFPKTEEQFPTSIPEKIPYLGRMFKASEVAFKGSAIRARADLFDMMIEMYKKTGKELDDKIVKDLGVLVNAITARGKVGQIGSSKVVQMLLWAPKMLKADWDVLTGHTFGAGLETNFARKQAAKTIFGLVVATAGVVAIAEAMGADVEKDPRGSEFLKIRIENTTFNSPFLRGIPQIVTLMARLLTRESKDSRTTIISKLNSGDYGSKTLFDIGLDFLANKTTPFVRAGINVTKGRDISGKPPTIQSTLFGFTPISLQNIFGLKDEASAQAVVGAFTDIFGIGSNTYSRDEDWSTKTTEEMEKFKEQVGEEKFKEANEEYNKLYNEWLLKRTADKEYLEKTDEEKQEIIKKKKADFKKGIFSAYGYKKEAKEKTKTKKLWFE